MANEKIIVQLARPERKYVKVYHDFLDNSLLSAEEQLVFIVLKSFIDFSDDSGEAFPSMETICKRAKMSEKRARKNINALIKKGIAKKIQRGLTKTNLYTLSDYATMWACDNTEDMAAAADNGGIEPMTAEEHIAELERMGYKVEVKGKPAADTNEPPNKTQTKTQDKEKGLDSEARKAHYQAPQNNISDTGKDSTAEPESQAENEKYSIEDVKALYERDGLVEQYPDREQEIDSCINILYDTLNTQKASIRIGGEDKPTNVVKGRLLKLKPEDIIFVIEKFHEQDTRIKNVTAYLLTALYNAPGQAHADLMNLGHHNHDF